MINQEHDIKSLINLPDLNITNNEGQAPIHLASREGRMDIVQCLTEVYKVDIDNKDANGTTPLLEAAINGHLSIIEYFIEKGCDPQSRNAEGNTVAHFAALNGHLSILKYFKENYLIGTALQEGNISGEMTISSGAVHGKCSY